MRLFLALATATVLLGGCFKTELEDGTIRCSSVRGKECPSGYYCAGDLFCWQMGHGPGDLAMPVVVVDMSQPPTPANTLTLSIGAIGAAKGTVSSSPAGINCTSNCSGNFDVGAMVTLTATPDKGFLFRGWSGDCTGLGTCTVTMDAAHAVTATFTAYNYMFVLSSRLAPSMIGGLTGADMKCNAAAGAAGLPGNYKPWLSTTTVNAKDRFANVQSWIRVDGLPFAASVTTLIQGKILYPPFLTETGATLTPSTDYVWTGTGSDGTVNGTNTCGDWATTAGKGMLGTLLPSPGLNPTAWSAYSLSADCAVSAGNMLHLYCLGTDLNNPLVINTPSRKAFVVLAANFPGTNGIAIADKACADAGANAHLDGSFKALLATENMSALSRFHTGADSLPWARPDGVLIANAAADLATGKLIAPLNETADGSPLSLYSQVWTGSQGLPGTDANSGFTCKGAGGDWTSTSATQPPGGAYGLVGPLDKTFFYIGMSVCSAPPSSQIYFYCLQE
jgi:hypothetical protein